MYIVVGLGNPGEEYLSTRHNTGRLAVDFLDKKDLGGVKIVHLDTFMNKSGSGVAKNVKSKKAAEKLIVIYDDLDLPFGTMRVSYDRGSGGHKGLESIIRALKTTLFIRIRIGIGRKPDIEKHILGNFRKPELDELKKIFKKVQGAIETIVESGLTQSMTEFNKS